jgi:VWFA-related protein
MILQAPKHFITIALSFALCCITVSSSHSTQSQEIKEREQKKEERQKQSDPIVRLETELVQIDVVVTDKDGKLVSDLRREDFELLEDGKRQQITHFAAGTSKRPATWLKVERRPADASANDGKTVATTTETLVGRYLVIAVDDYHLAPENLLIAKRTLHRFLNEQMVPGDQVAVVTTSGNVGLFQQFTNERSVLERAINRLSVQTRSATSVMDVPRITDYQAELIDRGDMDALDLAVSEIMRLEPMPSPPPGGGRGGRGGFSPASGSGASPRERAIMQAQSKARLIVSQNASYTRTTLTTLESVIRNLRTLPGRKMMVLLSDGFFLGGNSSSQLFDLRRIIDAATRAGVVIYSIDARGLVAKPPGGDASEPSNFDPGMPGVRERIENSAIEAKRDGIYSLARDTGGMAFFNNNDLNLGLQRVLDDNEIYYVLAYEPPESRRDGRFHRIDVRIPDQPNLKVRTRKGYLAPIERTEKKENQRTAEKQKEVSPDKAAQEVKAAKEAQIRTGLSSLFPLREIPIDLAVDFIDADKIGSAAIINAHFDASALEFQQSNGLHHNSVDLTVVIFDERGKVASSFTERLNLSLKQNTLDHTLKNGFNYYKLVSLKAGFYQARVAAREEGTGRLGSGTAWVEVPDLSKNQLTLSSILLSPGVDVDQNKNDSEAAYQSRPSTARRKFKGGSKVDFLVFAYNATAEKGAPDLVIQSQIYSGSKLVYASPLAKMALPQDGDLKRIPYAARISLDGFETGEYELRLMSIDRSTKVTAHRRVNFTVE